MQEEVNQKTIAFTTQNAKITARVLKEIIEKYLRDQEQKKSMKQSKTINNSQSSKRKMSLKELSKKYDGLKNVEIDNTNIKGFEKYAKKYHLEYALKKDKTMDPPTYVIFFKGKDTDMIDRAFKDFIGKDLMKQKPSLITEIKKYAEIAKNLVMNKTKHKHQEQSL